MTPADHARNLIRRTNAQTALGLFAMALLFAVVFGPHVRLLIDGSL